MKKNKKEQGIWLGTYDKDYNIVSWRKLGDKDASYYNGFKQVSDKIMKEVK